MQNHSTTKDKQVALTERRLIERWQSDGISHRQIAALLGTPQKLLTMKLNVVLLDNRYVKEELRKSIGLMQRKGFTMKTELNLFGQSP